MDNDFINTAEVVDFGKIFFIHQKLPNMNLIVFKRENYCQAVCINVELDAVGKDAKEACENLRRTLEAYIKQMIHNYNNEKAAVDDIVKVAFSEGELKSRLFSRYKQEKQRQIMEKIAKKNKIHSRKDHFVLLWKMIFPPRPIIYSLAISKGY